MRCAGYGAGLTLLRSEAGVGPKWEEWGLCLSGPTVLGKVGQFLLLILARIEEEALVV